MIRARFWMEGKSFCMSVKGHADSAPYGEDIVCAGASITAQTLVADVQSDFWQHKLKEEPVSDVGTGEILLKAEPKRGYRRETKAKFLHTQKGFELLADAYPEYVILTRFPAGMK